MDYERLARRHKDAVYAQMVRVCGNRDDAEDVLVQALLSAYRSLHQLRDEAGFAGWLATIGRRICGRVRRKEALEPILRLADAVGVPAAAFDVESEAEAAMLKDCVSQALNMLPEEQRETYLLDLEGHTAAEIGRILGASVPAVKSRLHRARAAVREALDSATCTPLTSTG